jgi:hypothetical protein
MKGAMMRDVRKFRKKPVVVEAIRYEPHGNCAAVAEFIGAGTRICEATGASDVSWLIETLEGRMEARPGDWIIKGVKGEFYPCKPDIFEATYEPLRKER